MVSEVPIPFPRAVVNRLLQCAQSQPERETCGLIGGLHGRPVSVYPVANVAEPPTSRFTLDPGQQIAAMRTMRERGEDLFAVFHSHPSAPAEPSARDRAEAGYPDALQLIVSLGTRGVLELRGFRLLPGGGFVEVPLILQQKD